MLKATKAAILHSSAIFETMDVHIHRICTLTNVSALIPSQNAIATKQAYDWVSYLTG